VLPSPSSNGANESSRPGFDLGKDLKLIDQVFDAGTTDKSMFGRSSGVSVFLAPNSYAAGASAAFCSLLTAAES
jgi:hypothetical protein